MNYYGLTSLFNGIVVLTVGFYLLSRQWKNSLYQSFALFAASVGLWCIFYSFWQVQTNKESAFFFSRLLMFFCYFIPFAFLWFVCNLTNTRIMKWQSVFLLGIPVFLAFFAFSRFAIKNVESRLSFPFWPVPGILIDIYFTLLFLTVLFSFALLFHAYKKAAGLQKWQIKWVFLTFIPIWAGGCTNIPLWYNIPIYPAPNFFVGIGLLVLSYAIIRSRLFDVDILTDLVQEAKLSALGIMATSINHEVRNPLFVIRGLAETQLERLQENAYADKEQLAEKSKEMLQKTIQQADRALEIIRNFSEYAKRQSSKTFDREPLDLKEVLESIIPFVRSELSLDKIILDLNIPAKTMIQADRHSVEEIFLNLIVNACQAMTNSPSENSKVNWTSPGNLQSEENSPNAVQFPHCENWGNPDFHSGRENKSQDRCQGMPGGGRIDVSSHQEEKLWISIKVRDTGPGLSSEQLSRIFEPFYTTKSSGTGLGLYVVKQLVEKNGGRIEVESAQGVGTTFILRFFQGQTLSAKDKNPLPS